MSEILENIQNKLQIIINKKFSNDSFIKRKIDKYHDRWNFCCPYCSDSRTNNRKKRGNLYLNDLRYFCFNCGYSTGINKLLHDFEGPRVLSDRRYKEDCSVLYYRYGGMMPYCKYDTLGRPCYYIQDNTGKNVEDVRTPYYEKPYFVKDPFRMGKLPKSKLLQQYQIRNVIDYKNSGGI